MSTCPLSVENPQMTDQDCKPELFVYSLSSDKSTWSSSQVHETKTPSSLLDLLHSEDSPCSVCLPARMSASSM